MKVLIFRPSGSGKTYIAHALQQSGTNAYDCDEIKGLSAWYDQRGQKIATPITAHEAIANHYSFLWSRTFLENFLAQCKEVYLFGGSGNVFNMIDLFDKVFFLKVDLQTQKNRLLNSRKGSLMNFDEDELVIWGDWLQEARKRDIPFVDATLSPKDIFDIMSED